MIRLTLRQFRTEALVALASLLILAVFLAVSTNLYDTAIAGCKGHGDCASLTLQFIGNDPLLQLISDAMILLPGIIGVFWGAPLIARELETGTYRLVWTQSVTRTRWLAAKLGVVGLASMIVAGIFSLVVTWWFRPIDPVVNQSQFYVFDQRDIVPIGYAAFAFVLGVTAGLLIRRILPAMVTTLVAFVAVRLAIENAVRPHFAAPLTLSESLSNLASNSGSSAFPPSQLSSTRPGAWVLSNNMLNAAGHIIYGFSCGGNGGSKAGGQSHAAFVAAMRACLAQYRQVMTYQPASRFWTFQWYETAVFLGLALLLAGFCVWWVRHCLT